MKLYHELKICLFVIISIIMLSPQLPAQEETLISGGDISHGYFVGPVIKYTQIKDEPALLVGVRGGWIINHSIIIGIGGYGLVNDIRASIPQSGEYGEPFIEFGYGGLELEYVIQSDRLLHFSIYMLIGGGCATYKDEYLFENFERDFGNDSFLVFEPAGNFEINVTNFFRIEAGIGYRVISRLDFLEFDNTNLAGLSTTLTFKLGKF